MTSPPTPQHRGQHWGPLTGRGSPGPPPCLHPWLGYPRNTPPPPQNGHCPGCPPWAGTPVTVSVLGTSRWPPRAGWGRVCPLHVSRGLDVLGGGGAAEGAPRWDLPRQGTAVSPSGRRWGHGGSRGCCRVSARDPRPPLDPQGWGSPSHPPGATTGAPGTPPRARGAPSWETWHPLPPPPHRTGTPFPPGLRPRYATHAVLRHPCHPCRATRAVPAAAANARSALLSHSPPGQ